MFLCQTQMALTKMVLWFGVVIIVMVTITKFMFICVWKSMRTMNDDLMVRIAINQALLSSMVIGMLLKFRIQVNCIFMLKVTENSHFYPKVPRINACSYCVSSIKDCFIKNRTILVYSYVLQWFDF